MRCGDPWLLALLNECRGGRLSAQNYMHILTDIVLVHGIGIYPRHSLEYVLALLGFLLHMVMRHAVQIGHGFWSG